MGWATFWATFSQIHQVTLVKEVLIACTGRKTKHLLPIRVHCDTNKASDVNENKAGTDVMIF
jgi:hypothetical protein